MIHAAARGEAYSCFVRPDTRIPFMAMPDGVEALLQLASAPRERLRRTAYNVGAFNPSAEEVRQVVLAGVPRREDRLRGRRAAPGDRGFVAGRPRRLLGAEGLGLHAGLRFRAGVLGIPHPDDPPAIPEVGRRPPPAGPARGRRRLLDHTLSTIFPWAPGAMTASCAAGASASANSRPTTGRSVPALRPAPSAA